MVFLQFCKHQVSRYAQQHNGDPKKLSLLPSSNWVIIKMLPKALINDLFTKVYMYMHYVTRYLQIVFTIDGPSYIKPVHTCTRQAPAFIFSNASVPLKIPPLATTSRLPLV